MSLLEDPGRDYRGIIAKGHFYFCPALMQSRSLIIVRPLYDANISDTTIPADMFTYQNCSQPFEHAPYDNLRLKADEEFILLKSKKRRVVALTGLFDNSFVQVAPVYTLKDSHGKYFNLDDLKNQRIPGIIYLESGDGNEESFISISESFPVFKDFLEPRRFRLNPEGLSLLDDQLILIYNLLSESD